jgi:hypothetical protein
MHPRGHLKQDARGHCAHVLSTRHAQLCVRLYSRRLPRGLLKQAGPEDGQSCAELRRRDEHHIVQGAHSTSGLTTTYNGNPLVGGRTGARHADGRLGGRAANMFGTGIHAACGRGGFYSKLNINNLNQTKQIGKYIFMENILHQLVY